MLIKISRYIKKNRKLLAHILFWIVMLAYYMSSKWTFESNKILLFEKTIFVILVQIALSYIIIKLLIPLLLSKKKRFLFGLSCLFIIYLTYVIYIAISSYYIVPKYPEIFSLRSIPVFKERITNGFAFLNNIPSLIFPTIILIMFEYYRHQKEVLTLKEQKKTSELEALKNQLNPHFLFNTLNNLYVLTLEKSDDAPEVIDKLSEILDYILYGCNEKFVPLANEIKLLNNYIALEKLRYGKRLKINFEYEAGNEANIAPLLLLTFLENAFKHGVRQETNKAFINIKLKVSNETIYFQIENTKPLLSSETNNQKRISIGLPNIKKQLNILYPNNYVLELNDNEQKFSANLNLITNV